MDTPLNATAVPPNHRRKETQNLDDSRAIEKEQSRGLFGLTRFRPVKVDRKKNKISLPVDVATAVNLNVKHQQGCKAQRHGEVRLPVMSCLGVNCPDSPLCPL